ncbi:hypothetical protein M3N55_10475 [Roseibaca sp. V10]|uniref:Flagellin n=1 Tax=Roseinatronobacter domitianus TaxID=2940293 RepID=A0ABT0M2T3_9RHOB|nr:hypothetical protein [Roseibaca domitiana]MCL1629157.1 hypothetical protein [Roseibaca domitiana]
MPRTKMCVNPELQQTYFRFNIYQPQTCTGEAEKVANIRREIGALKEEQQAFLRQNTKLGRLNKGLLVAQLIKETSYSFLDLAAAFAGDVLDKLDPTGVSGKNVEIVATAGMSSIDMTESLTNLAYGQGSWGNVIETSTRSTINIGAALADGPTQQAYAYLGTQGMNTYDLGRGSLGGQPDQTRQALENMGFDNATYVLGTVSDSLSGNAKTGVSGLNNALKTVKASRRYGQALETALEEYRVSQEDSNRSREVISESIAHSIAKLEAALQEAQNAYLRCMQPDGPIS